VPESMLAETICAVAISCRSTKLSAADTATVIDSPAKYRSRLRPNSFASPRAVATAAFIAGPAKGAISIAATSR